MVTRRYTQGFIHKLQSAKDFLRESGISPDSVLVAGSAVLEAYGLSAAHDIDIVYGKSHISLGTLVETNYEAVQISLLEGFEYGGKYYDIDTIVEDDEYHFVFYGLKFMNLDLLKKHMLYLNREKDIHRLRLIELFEDFALNFDDKRVLREQINEHLCRRFLS
jgi:hypothetical protein